MAVIYLLLPVSCIKREKIRIIAREDRNTWKINAKKYIYIKKLTKLFPYDLKRWELKEQYLVELWFWKNKRIFTVAILWTKQQLVRSMEQYRKCFISSFIRRKFASDKKGTSDWIKNFLVNLMHDYEDKYIFKADKSGLFYKALPNRTLVPKNKKHKGGKT